MGRAINSESQGQYSHQFLNIIFVNVHPSRAISYVFLLIYIPYNVFATPYQARFRGQCENA